MHSGETVCTRSLRRLTIQVRFLGTGAAEGLPGLFCGCDVCQQARKNGGKDLRTRSSIDIDGRLKIDFPPDSLYHIQKYGLDYSLLQHLLITHTHGDHFAVSELEYISQGFAWDRAILNIYGNRETCELVQAQSAEVQAGIHLHRLDIYNTVAIDRYQVTPLRATHQGDTHCLNYVIDDGSVRMLYACDTGWYDQPTWQALTGVKLNTVVLECTMGFVQEGWKYHIGLYDLQKLKQEFEKVGAADDNTKWYITHFSHNGSSEQGQALQSEMEAFCNPLGVNVAYDGLLVEI